MEQTKQNEKEEDGRLSSNSRFMMAALAASGFALATQTENVFRSGWSAERVLKFAAITGGALWAANSIESEAKSLHRWVRFYRDSYDRLNDRRS